MVEGGTTCWLYPGSDLLKYWDDGSYVSTTESSASKVLYGNQDHSAVKSSVSGKYESKWGSGPKMRHAVGYGPPIYNMSTKVFYKKAGSIYIDCPSRISHGQYYNFIIDNPPLSFTCSSSSNISASKSSSSVNVSSTTCCSSGWFSIMYGSYQLAKYNLDVSAVNITGPASVKSNGEYYASISGCTNPSSNNFVWNVIPASGGSYTTYYFGNNNCNMGVNFSTTGYYNIRAELNTSCGTQYFYKTVYANPSKSGVSGFIYPNPVDDILYVDLDNIVNTQNKTTITYDVRLYDGQGNVVHKTSAKSGIIQFNVSNLPNGIYFIHIYDGISSTPDVNKVIVSH